jgi:DNA (cytosine-5)-methyltransferase 1
VERIKTIGFVEKDKFCQKVLRKNFKDVPIEEDIRNVRGERYSADIISGGFPCQPFSVAGKRKGQDDDRYLWDETIRVVAETKPKWFVGENVEGIININNGLVLRQVQTDLEKEGFQVQCLVIPASGIGAWHQRKRVWIIANSNPRLSIGENKEIQARGNTIDSSSKDVSNSDSRLRRRRGTIKESGANEIWGFYPTQEEQTEQHIRSKAIGCDALPGEDVSNSNGKRLQRRSLSTNLETKQRQVSSKNSIKEQQTWWQTQSSLCGVPNGISYELDKGRANRIKSLGNSIVPQIAFEMGKAILAAEDDKID